MIKVIYFASIREQLDVSEEQLDSMPASVEQLIEQLCQRGETWRQVFAGDQTVLVAVNQHMSPLKTALADGDEVAFFPPVTGG